MQETSRLWAATATCLCTPGLPGWRSEPALHASQELYPRDLYTDSPLARGFLQNCETLF